MAYVKENAPSKVYPLTMKEKLGALTGNPVFQL